MSTEVLFCCVQVQGGHDRRGTAGSAVLSPLREAVADSGKLWPLCRPSVLDKE